MTTMRAAVADRPGEPDVLEVRGVPLPESKPGWVRIRVRAFGLNRSELMTRQGLSGDAVAFPRILGIEATGTIDDDPSGRFPMGRKAMTMMGGMGRSYDGGYAEYGASASSSTSAPTRASPTSKCVYGPVIAPSTQCLDLGISELVS